MTQEDAGKKSRTANLFLRVKATLKHQKNAILETEHEIKTQINWTLRGFCFRGTS